MITLLGEWRNIGSTEVPVWSVYSCYCSRTCAELQAKKFVYFGLKLFVQAWTYKCKVSRSAKRQISAPSLFQAIMCPWGHMFSMIVA